MHPRRIQRNAPVPFFTLICAAVLVGSPASAQLVVVEPGFDVTDLGSSSGPKGAECSPGGVWGPYVYIGESGGNAIEQLDFFNFATLFASGSPDIDFPVGMDFGPGPANDFGTFLFVASYGSGRITRLDPSGNPSLFTLFPSVSDVKFDPTGAYSNELFAIEYFSGISTVSSGGIITPFAAGIQTSYMRFGPGGAWGTGLYATNNSPVPGVGIIQVDSGGTSSMFSPGFTTPEQFDWAFGGAWGGDMFATDFATGELWRVKSDGSRTLFATVNPGERPAGLVFCNDCIYMTSYGGGCWKICEAPVPVESRTWGGIKQGHGSVDAGIETPRPE